MNSNLLSNKLIASIFAIVCTLLWGSAFPAIKLGYEEFHIASDDIKNILLFAGVRFFFASCLIILIECFLERKWIYPSKNNIFSIMIIGLINTFLQYFFFYIGLVNTSGSKSSVLNSSVTFFTLVIAHFIFREDQLTIKKIIGCLFGITGVMAINLNLFKIKNDGEETKINLNENRESNRNGLSFSVLGDGMILLSSLSSALGTILIKIYYSTNKDELFYNYKNWKMIKLLKNMMNWWMDKLKNGYYRLSNYFIKKFNHFNEKEIELEKNYQVKNNINSMKKEDYTYPYNFDKYFESSNLSSDDNKHEKLRGKKDNEEKIEYISSVNKMTFNKNELQMIDESMNTPENSLQLSKDLNDDNSFDDDETDFEDIDISTPSNKQFSIKDSNKNDKKYEYDENSKINKGYGYNDIVDLYLYDNEENDIIMLTGYQMLFGSLFLIITGFLWGIIFKVDKYYYNSNNNTDWGSAFHLKGYLIVGYMIIITSLAFSLWNILIKYNSVGFLSFFNFLIPIFGTLFSGLLLNENILTIENGISLLLVSFGVIISSI